MLPTVFQDSTFYCELFYPGQSVVGPGRIFRDAQWINGPRPVLTGNQRVCCVIEEVMDVLVSHLLIFLVVYLLLFLFSFIASHSGLETPDNIGIDY